MIDNTSHSPENIRKRLDKLRRWQEQQQKILIEKQNVQRELLNKEQQEVYRTLGLSGCTEPVGNTECVDDSFGNSFFASNTGKEFDVKRNCEGSITGTALKSEKGCTKRPFLKRGEGLKNRFKIDPEAFRLHNLPKYKYANAHSKLSKDIRTQRQKGKRSSDSNKNSKVVRNDQIRNISHEPSLKKEEIVTRSFVASRTSKLSYNIEDVGTDFEDQLLKSRSELQYVVESVENNSSQSDEADLAQISWAQVLSSENGPSTARTLREQLQNSSFMSDVRPDDSESTSIFELLEKKLEEDYMKVGLVNSSKHVNAEKYSLDDTLDTLSENEAKILKSLMLKPQLCDTDENCLLDESDNESCSESSADIGKDKMHVRFSKQIQVNQIEVPEDHDFENMNDVINKTKTSTPKNKIDSEERKIISTKEDETSEDSITAAANNISIEQEKAEILKNSDMLKTRLKDLEQEIADFQKHNAELISLRQQYEIDKMKLSQEHTEMKEKLNDDRIRIEIYLHDERMKIEEGKKKYEKLLKDAKVPNRREREEITKLKEQIEILGNENKAKENKHVAAQARLRAQIRNLEKEVKELNFEIDQLRKEKKKLECENSRLSRQNNNKMLQEINKSLSKLAPKQVDVTNIKKTPGKVISTKMKSSRNVRSKSFPELCGKDDDSTNTESLDSDQELDSAESTSNLYNERHKVLPNRTHCVVENDVKKGDESSSESQTNISKQNFKREIQNGDGSKDIWYTNGNIKKISSDGMLIRMLYYNKDIKETNIAEGTVKYYYFETNTWHTTYLDGLEILEFPNGQTEHRYKDGTIEVHFPNGSIRISNPADEHKIEEWRYPDGATVTQMKNGEKILIFPNGQREVHTKDHKRREYPDGTVKLVYLDGSQETRYSNGRVRLKDKDGNLVMDSDVK